VHAHVTPLRFQRAVLNGKWWYGMGPDAGELDNPKNRWLPMQRLEAMDEAGVDIQLVSPTDVFYQYHQAPDVTACIAAECNDEVAQMVRDHPTRFMGLGTLPMQDPDRAIAEAERGMRQLGLRICLGHAGGYVPYAVDRMDKGWEMWPDLRGRSLAPPSTYVRRFYYDSVTYTDRNLRFLLDSVGADRVLIDQSPLLQADERAAILYANTARLFGA
jgi:aminocarboxymuconate-semialdehyde decarboxylase